MIGGGSGGKEYFATKVGKAFTSALMERVSDYYQALMQSRRLDLYKRLATGRYLGYFRGAQTQRGGTEDEFTLLHENHFANLLTHMATMTSSSRPSFEPQAVNTDHKSRAQTLIARNVVEYYNREKGLGEIIEDCIDGGVTFGETEALAEWDAHAGDDYMADPNNPGKTLKDGDIAFRVFGPIDVIRDVMLTSAKKRHWAIYRDFDNKFDLAARFPEARDRILNMQVDAALMSNRWLSPWTWKEGDVIPIYTFYHDRTPACPNGRYSTFIDGDGPIMDGPLPYKFYPGFRLAPQEQKGTPFGYSVSFDLLPIQEMIDLLASIISTNQSNFGVSNILVPNEAGLNVKQISDGLNALYFDSKFGKPEVLELLKTPAEIFTFIDRLIHVMETISGINSVARGNPEASLKSGAALALVQSMAIQFNSGLQKAYNRQAEGLATAVIRILHAFPKTKRMVEIAGKANRSYLKAFDPSELGNISRVRVDLGNPLARTTAGKVQMAQDLLQQKLVNADEYIQVLTTGNLEPMLEGKQSELMLISSENENLSDGTRVSAAVTDDHALHVQEHKTVLASPEARQAPEVVKAVTDHITEHINMLQTLSATNPNLLIALGQQPVPPPPAPPGATPQGPGLPTGAPPAGGPPAALLNPTPPGMDAAAKVKPAGMPTNPLTKEKASPLTPGPV